MKKIGFIEKHYLTPWIVNIWLVLVYLFGITGSPLYTSVLNVTTKADPFDGTVMPFSMVPDYRVMTDRTLTFSEIDSNKFIDIPKYDPNVFWKNLDNLTVWSDAYKEAQIAKLIYTTPYMGTYKSDYKEYAGSHLAVDIKAPIWTPVKSIANGVVVLSDYQASWYGNVIVVRHENVNYNWKTVNLFSWYAHLNSREVSAWDKVSRGEMIWTVWNTWGTSTGSHLHFQIDVDNAPYHLYWPFSSQDTRDAGVSFYGWINAWVWKENAMKYTIHPINFIYKYQNNSVATDSSDNISVVIEKPEENNNQNNSDNTSDTKDSNEIVSSIDKPDNNSDNSKNNQDNTNNSDNNKESSGQKEDEKAHEEIVIKKEEKVTIADVDDNENVVSSNWGSLSNFTWTLNINSYDTVSLLDEVDKTEEEIKKDDEEKIEFNSAPEKPTEPAKTEETNNNQNNSDNKDEDKKETPKFTDINKDYKYYYSIEYFRERGLIAGYSDWTFKPENNISRVENLKMLSVWLNLWTSKDTKQYFGDVWVDSWQLKYVNKFVEMNILSLKNKLFNPNNNLTRIEGLKLLLKAKWISMDKYAERKISVTDVESSAWYYPYVVYAVENELLEYSDNKFEPNKQLTRWEVVNMMYLER